MSPGELDLCAGHALHAPPRRDLHFAEVPLLRQPLTPSRTTGASSGPTPLKVEVLFLPEALDRSVTESQIRWVMEHDPEGLYAIRANKPNLDLDGIYGTVATYASALVPNSGGGIEIALRAKPQRQVEAEMRTASTVAIPMHRVSCLVVALGPPCGSGRTLAINGEGWGWAPAHNFNKVRGLLDRAVARVVLMCPHTAKSADSRRACK